MSGEAGPAAAPTRYGWLMADRARLRQCTTAGGSHDGRPDNAMAGQFNQRTSESRMGMLKEFRDFAVKGNVIDLAVGVIIGGAFGTIVNSAVKDLIMPIIGSLGSVDFKEYFVILSKPANYAGPMTYDALNKAGVPLFAYGQFLTVMVNFIILAFIIFWMVKAINRVKAAALKEEAAAPAAPAEDVLLLREIRDALKK
jgi:large conductance mechanosensitive channel